MRNNKSSLPGLMKQYAGVVEACEREREINNLVCLNIGLVITLNRRPHT